MARELQPWQNPAANSANSMVQFRRTSLRCDDDVRQQRTIKSHAKRQNVPGTADQLDCKHKTTALLVVESQVSQNKKNAPSTVAPDSDASVSGEQPANVA